MEQSTWRYLIYHPSHYMKMELPYLEMVFTSLDMCPIYAVAWVCANSPKFVVRHPSVIVKVGGFKHVNATVTYFEGDLTSICVILLLLLLVLLLPPLHLLPPFISSSSSTAICSVPWLPVPSSTIPSSLWPLYASFLVLLSSNFLQHLQPLFPWSFSFPHSFYSDSHYFVLAVFHYSSFQNVQPIFKWPYKFYSVWPL